MNFITSDIYNTYYIKDTSYYINYKVSIFYATYCFIIKDIFCSALVVVVLIPLTWRVSRLKDKDIFSSFLGSGK